ncbi:MAG: 30S ribosomal protein S16 [Parcubacteria group bacterium GW2011_GWA2_42_28]|nr:MAG: 30S ribosomal protein S16 [Parcubacteria group bacterium GW2011_GWA2_42_28]
MVICSPLNSIFHKLMLAIKLARFGKKKQPTYRMIVLPKTKDPKGDYIENVGIYNPRSTPKTIELKADRIKYWISVGAQPTDTVHNLLVSRGIIESKKRNVSKINKTRAVKLGDEKKAKEDAIVKAKADAEAKVQAVKDAEAKAKADAEAAALAQAEAEKAAAATATAAPAPEPTPTPETTLAPEATPAPVPESPAQ